MSNPVEVARAPVRWATRLWAAMCITSALGLGWSPYATAQDEAKPSRQAFRVCQDPNNLPFSNVGGDGIENRIVWLLGGTNRGFFDRQPVPRGNFARNADDTQAVAAIWCYFYFDNSIIRKVNGEFIPDFIVLGK